MGFHVWASNWCWAACVGSLWAHRGNLTCERRADEHSDHVALRPLSAVCASSQHVLRADLSSSSFCRTLCHHPQPGTGRPPLLLLASEAPQLRSSLFVPSESFLQDNHPPTWAAGVPTEWRQCCCAHVKLENLPNKTPLLLFCSDSEFIMMFTADHSNKITVDLANRSMRPFNLLTNSNRRRWRKDDKTCISLGSHREGRPV